MPLLAIDLDGTLLRSDGTLDPRDEAAIVRARRDGVHVALATGRLATGALPTSRALDLDGVMICVDGALLACARTARAFERTAIALAMAERVVAAMTERLETFVFHGDAIHCGESARAHTGYVMTWSREVVVHPRLADARRWREEEAIVIALGLGDEAAVRDVRARLDEAHGSALDLATFPMGEGVWAVRAQRAGCSKGRALEALAARLGVPRAEVAAVGDWYNDVSMLAWAGRSFAMGQAPDEVKAAATDALVATSATGGGVAEALTRWRG